MKLWYIYIKILQREFTNCYYLCFRVALGVKKIFCSFLKLKNKIRQTTTSGDTEILMALQSQNCKIKLPLHILTPSPHLLAFLVFINRIISVENVGEDNF